MLAKNIRVRGNYRFVIYDLQTQKEMISGIMSVFLSVGGTKENLVDL